MSAAIAAIAIGITGGVAAEQMPPPDAAADPWLREIERRVFDDARVTILIGVCDEDDRSKAIEGVAGFSRDVHVLTPADAAFANRIFQAGQRDANDALDRNRAAACRVLTPALRQRFAALVAGRTSWWDVPNR